ncbi:MAG: ATP-binding protein [Cyanophyceae cyanobacterium]
MLSVPRFQRRHYGVAILSVASALLLTKLLLPFIAPTVSLLFFAAVMLSTWYGGLGPGLLATVLAVLASDYFLIPPLYSLGQVSGADFLQLAIFSLLAITISSLNASLRAAKEKAEHNLRRLQESEEQYRRLVDTAYEGIWLLDAAMQTEYVNQRMAEMLGYSPQEMQGRSLYEFMDCEARAEAERIVERRKQGVKEQFDFCYRRQDGSKLWAIVSTRPRISRQGEFLGSLAMLTDITTRKQIEQEREQLLKSEQEARQEAEIANRTKDEFLAIVSHELRSPLNAILGWIQLLRTSSANEAMTAKALSVIERNAQAQNQLIEDLLDLSRIVQGKVRLSLCPLSLGPVVAGAIDTVCPTANNKQIQIKTQLATSVTVNGDPDRLQQVFGNLLNNAVKFTPDSGSIEVMLVQEDTQAVVHVKDSGIGIAPEFLPHVFERFCQGSLKSAGGGLGLGLAITRNLVELHGGTIAAASPGEGQGATFTVTLPLLPLEHQKRERLTNSTSPSRGKKHHC